MSKAKDLPTKHEDAVYIQEGSNYLHPPGSEPGYQRVHPTPPTPAVEYSTLDESVLVQNRPLPAPYQQPPAKGGGRCVKVCLAVLLVLVVLLLGIGGYLVWKVNDLSSGSCLASGSGSPAARNDPTQPKDGCKVLWRVIKGAGMRGGTAKSINADDCVATCQQDASCVAADVTTSTCTHHYDVTELVFNPNVENHRVVDRCHIFDFHLPPAENNNVRLTCDNAIMSDRGRVEVYDAARDIWGTVCDDYWDTADAEVACKQLGLSAVGAEAVQNAAFGSGFNLPIMLDDLVCTGSESTLQECTHLGLYNHTCDHNEDAALVCGPPDGAKDDRTDEQRGIRLVPLWCNGTLGRVEYYDRYRRAWGTVCDDRWDEPDAQVVCRTLGLSGGVAMPVGQSIFGDASGDIVLSCLECLGYEAEVTECGHDPLYTHDCEPHHAAAVICYLEDYEPYPIPTSCSMRYQAYPSLAGSGGSTIHGVSDPEVCLQMCSARFGCAAFDVNSRDKTCILYTKDQSTTNVNDVYSVHFKQLEKCAFTIFGI